MAGLEAVLAQDVRVDQRRGRRVRGRTRGTCTARPRWPRLYLGLAQKRGRLRGLRWLTLNGQPAVEVRFDGGPAGWPPRAVLQVETDEDGRITRLFSVMATCKLTALDEGAIVG